MEGAPTQPAVVALATDCCSCNGEAVRREAGSWGLGEGKGWKDEDWGWAPPLGAAVGIGVPGAPHPTPRHHLDLPIPMWGKEQGNGQWDIDPGTLGGRQIWVR